MPEKRTLDRLAIGRREVRNISIHVHVLNEDLNPVINIQNTVKVFFFPLVVNNAFSMVKQQAFQLIRRNVIYPTKVLIFFTIREGVIYAAFKLNA